MIPEDNDWDRPYWEHARQGVLTIQTCLECHALSGLPKIFCPKCESDKFEFRDVSPTGRIYSWTTVYKRFHPDFADVPFTILLVELTEHPEVHMVVQLDRNQDSEGLRIGMCVEMQFRDSVSSFPELFGVIEAVA